MPSGEALDGPEKPRPSRRDQPSHLTPQAAETPKELILSPLSAPDALASGPPQFLDPLELELVDFIEAYHSKYGEFPSRTVIETVLRQTGRTVEPSILDAFYFSPLVGRSLNSRGIFLPTQLEKSTSGLTKAQLALIAILTNPRDTRSDAKKLADCGISPREFAGWMLNKRFATGMSDAANNLFENAEADAHVGLVKKVRSGDMTAIKYYFEMTGRYNPAYESNVNLNAFMSSVIEAIQKHVHDPVILSALAAELQLASVANGITGQSISAGAVPVQTSSSGRKILAPPIREVHF